MTSDEKNRRSSVKISLFFQKYSKLEGEILTTLRNQYFAI